MDILSEQGHEVYAITMSGRMKWREGLTEEIVSGKLTLSWRSKLQKTVLRLLETLGLRDKIMKLLKGQVANYNKKMIKGLVKNWIESDVTFAGAWETAYTAYLLADKTVPIYYIQHYEELFEVDNFSQKAARLTYFMPLVLVVGSFWLRHQMRKRIGKDAYILYPGVPAIDCSAYQKTLNLEQKYSKPGKLKIISYGNIKRDWYGFADQVEAMRLVFFELGTDNVEWTVFGAVPYLRVPPGVKFTYTNKRGPNLVPLFLESHISIIASWYSGFHGGPLEPMTAGTAVVSTDVGGEEVVTDGKDSLVVPPRDPKAMAAAIIKLAKDRQLAKKLAQEGLETAKRFNWENTATNLSKIISEEVKTYSFKGAYDDIQDLIDGKKDAIIKSREKMEK